MIAQRADGLQPAEAFFDALALDLADGIAGVTGGAAVDRGASIGVILGNMWCAVDFTAAGDELGGVVILVGLRRGNKQTY